MRTCLLCSRELPLEDFYKNSGSIGGRLRRCKTCVVEVYRQGRSERAKRDRLYFQKVKLERGCADCGYNANPVALDFDHMPGSVKLYRVACMAGMRRVLIDAEIAKCEVVCANCHRIRTSNRLVATEAMELE